MDVLRTGVSVLGCVEPEGAAHDDAGARALADRLLASLGVDAALLAPLRAQRQSGSRSRRTTTRLQRIFCICCTAKPSAEWTQAMQVSLILYAEHEFNASTFTARVIAGTGSDLHSCITGAIGALKGPQARRRERSGAGDSAALRFSR
jgi:2-methylcitrate synthase